MKWSKSEEDILLDNLNLHYNEIAILLNRSYTSILNKIERLGMKDTYLSLTEEKRNIIKSDINKKSSIRAKNRNFGGYTKGGGRGKSGYYKGYWCDSTYELAWVIYHIENNISFIRNTQRFRYIHNNEEKFYIPDFIIDDVYFELKGYRDDKVDSKIQYFPFKIKLLFRKDMNNIFEYVTNKYGKNFFYLYENFNFKKCSKCGEIIFNKKNKNGICRWCISNISSDIKKFKIIKVKKTNNEKRCSCGAKIFKRSNYCRSCYILSRRKIEIRPNLNILSGEVKLYGYVKTGKKYGVSDNTIRKWLKNIQVV